MSAEAIKDAESRACIEIDGSISCYDPKPKSTSRCTNIGGSFFCKARNGKDGKIDTTFREEARKAMNILLYPKIRVDEARHSKGVIVQYTIGFISSALVFTVSLYIKSMIDTIMLFFMSGAPATFISLLTIIIILIIVSIALAFAEYRARKALDRTNLLETLAEKDIAEGMRELSR